MRHALFALLLAACGAPPASAPPAIPEAPESPLVDRVLVFPPGSLAPDPADAADLDLIAAWLVAHPEAGVLEVEGHTDTRGSAEYNLALSDRRARAVVRALEARGVPGARLRAVPRGESTPAHPGPDPRNARVTFRLAR